MRILLDFHHGALYYSFHLLFEKRLGWELYRPIGYDWYRKDFWRYSTNPFVIKQYLQIPSPSTGDGIYLIPTYEGTDLYTQRAITLRKFMNMDFDIIIATVYNHEKPYSLLAQKKNAVFIRQLGNIAEVCDFGICRNIINSSTTPIPEGVNHVTYRPEFSLDDYSPPKNHNVIKNFMNCYPETEDALFWYEYKEDLPEFIFKMHGILGDNGVLSTKEMPEAIRGSSFVWHLKRFGDGYGFVVHQSYASGRPIIVKKSYYKGKLAEPLFEDSVTCIDLELGTQKENIKKIRHFSEPENHMEICENAYRRFREVVDFDEEFYAIKKFLEEEKK